MIIIIHLLKITPPKTKLTKKNKVIMQDTTPKLLKSALRRGCFQKITLKLNFILRLYNYIIKLNFMQVNFM